MKVLFGLILLMVMNVFTIWAQRPAFPGEHWQKYLDVTEAGFAPMPLDSLQRLLQSSKTEALLVVHEGKILFEYGNVDRRLPQASIRKSYLNALFGKYDIDVNKTLEALHIDDIQPLTAQEKQAKILDLLAARSGIYLPSAYSPESMEVRLPERGSHARGTHWFYNNWDFNVLNTIFQKETGKDFFKTFETDIAQPLQMQDFRLSDTYYRYEKDKSQHPAYLFKLSARDMARFGLLYLNQGKWKRQQIIPADWVQRSTSVFTADLGKDFENRGAYGLLWWVAEPPLPTPMFYASGLGGQRMYVLPENKLVVVHLTDLYQNQGVSEAHLNQILQLLLQAQRGKAKRIPKLVAQHSKPLTINPIQVADSTLQLYTGTYQHRVLGDFKIFAGPEHNGLWLEIGLGLFRLLPTGAHTFWVEDIELPVEFVGGDAARKGQVISVVNDKRTVQKVAFYY